MIYEFEGRTEKEAIELAIKKLGLKRDHFDVELVDSEKRGPFTLKKRVNIRIHLHDAKGNENNDYNSTMEPEDEFETVVVNFIQTMLEKMGFNVGIQVIYRKNGKIELNLESNESAKIIGRKGRSLDAIQRLTNGFVRKRFAMKDDNTTEELKAIVDVENYRGKREESLILLAQTVGDRVARTKHPQLLRPMNPFERRIIHTTLRDIENIETVSEGVGHTKQVKIIYRGI